MSGAQSWSVKGIDPKVREAAREAAARQGMSLGEYLSHALAGNTPVGGTPTPAHTPPQPGRQRSTRYFGSADENTDDDWSVGGSAPPRVTDPARLAQRIESIERRTQLAVTGLDRAVSTIDRSLLGLAARVEDAEAAATESADRIGDALDQFRAASETLSGTHGEISSVRERLEHQVSVAEEVARRAEAAASYLSNEMESRDSALQQTLSEARGVAEEAARQAAEASADAVQELRRLQEQMSERLAETETSTRRAVETAIAEVRSETSNETRGTREALLEEVVRLESEIAKRVGAVDTLKSEQATLIARIERAEAGSRESTAGLRQAAGAAIADLRNAQLTLSARVKQVEDIAGASGAIDLSDLRHAQTDIAERLASLETRHSDAGSPVTDALAAFEARLAAVEHGGGSPDKLEHVDGAVKTLDVALQRLSERIAETESTANTAIRTLEETVTSLGARVEQGTGAVETEAVRAMLEQRLDGMAQDVAHMVGEARNELAGQLQAALEGVAGEGLEGALADVNRRLAAAERRQAQTIEAISLEIRRMSETVDKRLRAVESRNDDAAGAAVREELSKMATTLEKRFDDIERREAGAFDRMGLEIGRLSERLEERVGAVEGRSAQAIEQVGEQVARMADRFNQRQDILARDLGERMLDSEERAGQRVTEAINSIMQRLAEVEEHSAEAIMPVQKAVSSVASKLERIESGHDAEPLTAPMDAIPTPSRRSADFDFPSFDEPASEPYVSPMAAAQPVRAAPMAPSSAAPQLREAENEHDIYFAEEIDDLLEDDLVVGDEADAPFTPPEYKSIDLAPDSDLVIDEFLDDVTAVTPPPVDDDPFWSPNAEVSVDPATPLASAPSTFDATTDFGDSPDFGDLPDLDAELHDTLHGEEPALDLTGAAPAFEEAPAPAGKNDYLANARKAALAQAQTKPGKPGKEPKAAKAPKQPKAERESARVETPKLSLRGSSRIILWGAASLVALAVIGGAKYISDRNDDASTAEPPQPVEPTAAPVQGSDPNAPYGEAADPFAEAPAEGLAPVTGANGEVPVAANDAPVTPVVAGPLPARASQSLEQAATSGNLTAQYELALQRIAAGRSQEGVTLLRRAADRGFAMAQYRLAKLYERGEGVQADLAVARQWTERAAASGNRRAMHDLGVYFARGEGAPLDEAAAFRWFRQAAELGVADSQYNLGVLYQQGRGVNASASEALFWFLVAARQGDQDAGARATALEGQLQQNQVEQARARAQAFRPRAASAVANGEFGQRAWAARPAT